MKYIIWIIIVLTAGVISVAYFFFRDGQPSEVSSEIAQHLKERKPVLSEDKDTYFSLLADNAISGGPPKDGIPSIDNPQYTNATEADEWLRPNDVVFGIDYEGFVAAYPQRIVVWHEIVNEKIGGKQVSITYCPLTGTTIGFGGEYAPNASTEFGVSGKLVNSNLIMYDRKSDSYWPQIVGRAITGPAKGSALEEFPVIWTTWEKWKSKYPDTRVLSPKTGFFRDYGEKGDPYGSYLADDKGYYESDRLLFDPINEDSRLHPKEVVIGIRDVQGNAAAILKNALRERSAMEIELGEKLVEVVYKKELDSYEARYADTQKPINAFDAMWFAWVAFYPNTTLWQ